MKCEVRNKASSCQAGWGSPVAPNKPIGREGIPPFHYSIIPVFQSRAYRAKQTQFAPNRCEGQVPCGKGVMSNWSSKWPRQNKANSGAGRLVHAAAILSRGGSTVAPGAQTKPIGGCDRVKQSQSAATRCTNKANLPTPTTKRRRRAGPQQNKANFRPSDRRDGPGMRHCMPATPAHATRGCKKSPRRGTFQPARVLNMQENQL